MGRNLNKDYVYEKTYPSLIEAKDGILNREIGAQLWTRSVSYSTQEGDKICYTCRGYPRCPRKMQMLLDPASQDVHVSVSSDEHSHILGSTSKQLNPLSRDKVFELLAAGVTKPRKILKQLQLHNFPMLTRTQINNLKQRTNKKVNLKNVYKCICKLYIVQ